MNEQETASISWDPTPEPVEEKPKRSVKKAKTTKALAVKAAKRARGSVNGVPKRISWKIVEHVKCPTCKAGQGVMASGVMVRHSKGKGSVNVKERVKGKPGRGVTRKGAEVCKGSLKHVNLSAEGMKKIAALRRKYKAEGLKLES
ncbi:MAG: hypothetical protein ACRD5H_00900 [Nitrososphaerales archaeon]